MKISSRLDDYLKSIKKSDYYCQPINFDLKFQNMSQITIKVTQTRQHQFVSKIPQIKFSLSPQIVQKINQDISKSRKTKNGLFSAYENKKCKHQMQKVHYFSQKDQQDVGGWQEAEDAFCVGFIVQKQGNYQQFHKRLTVQLTKCLQKKFQIVYAKNTESEESLSSLNPIQKIMYKNFRFFLVYQPLKNNSLLINRIMYYPDAKFLIKPIKLDPSKFTANKVYQQALTFKTKCDFGYLSLSNNSKTKQIRFLLIDKFDPQLNSNPPPMIGVWVASQKFQSKEEQRNYFWAVIMEYLRNPALKIKVSVNYPNSGILFTIQKAQKTQKISAYMFQIIEQPKWNFKYQPEVTFKMPEQYAFSDQQVIVEEDKQQSDIESIQNKSIMKNNNGAPMLSNYLPENSHHYLGGGQSGISQPYDLSKSSVQNKSINSNDQKDLEIKFLKKQLQFYKNRCQALQKTLNNPNMMQFQAMQMMNPMMNHHLGFNPNIMYQNHLQQSGMHGQQPNFMQPMFNQPMNAMYNPNWVNQNPALQLSKVQSANPKVQSANSKAQVTNSKVLNQSDIYEQQIQLVPEPLLINKQLAFNKKKTFEEQRTSKLDYSQSKHLKKKQSCPDSFNRQVSQKNEKNINSFAQFPSEQDIQMSPNNKKYAFEYDYKNISFAQENSFDNQFNSTHKFGAFQASESQILGKSPDFKNHFDFNNIQVQNIDIRKDLKDLASTDNKSSKQIGNKKVQPRNVHEFSFDRKDEDFLSSKNSSKSPLKQQKVFQEDDQEYSQNSNAIHNEFLSKFQTKYSQNQYPEKIKEKHRQTNDKKKYQETTKMRQKHQLNPPSNDKQSLKHTNDTTSHSKYKQTLRNQHYPQKNNSKQQSNLENYRKKPQQTENVYKKDLQFNPRTENKTNPKQVDVSSYNADHIKNVDVSKKINLLKNAQVLKEFEGTKKAQIIQKAESSFQKGNLQVLKNKSPSISRIRQTVQNSDSDSDQQLRNIAMKYKK